MLPLNGRPYCASCKEPYNGLGYSTEVRSGKKWRICTLNSDPGVRAIALAPIALAVLCLYAALLAGGCASVPSSSSAHSPSPAGDPPPSTSPPPQAATSVTVAPASATLQLAQTQTFTAAVANDPQSKGVSWSLSNCSPGACGALSAASSASGTSITYTAPSQTAASSSIVLTATSVAVPAKSASAAISIALPAAPISVAVSPQAQTLTVNQTQDFTATVGNDTQNKGVIWTFSGAKCAKNACGTLSAGNSPSGTAITYTAPAHVPSPAAISLVATSAADSTVTATATITITITAPSPRVMVVVSPASQTVPVNHTQDFMATVQNDPQSKGVTWTLSGAGCAGALCGTLSNASSASGASITYTAPANAPIRQPSRSPLLQSRIANHQRAPILLSSLFRPTSASPFLPGAPASRLLKA